MLDLNAGVQEAREAPLGKHAAESTQAAAAPPRNDTCVEAPAPPANKLPAESMQAAASSLNKHPAESRPRAAISMNEHPAESMSPASPSGKKHPTESMPPAASSMNEHPAESMPPAAPSVPSVDEHRTESMPPAAPSVNKHPEESMPAGHRPAAEVCKVPNNILARSAEAPTTETIAHESMHEHGAAEPVLSPAPSDMTVWVEPPRDVEAQPQKVMHNGGAAVQPPSIGAAASELGPLGLTGRWLSNQGRLKKP